MLRRQKVYRDFDFAGESFGLIRRQADRAGDPRELDRQVQPDDDEITLHRGLRSILQKLLRV
jgi:hypothetical protein